MEIKFIRTEDGQVCKNYYSAETHPHKIKPYNFIIIHHTGSFKANGTKTWFLEDTISGKNRYSSAHYLITEEGQIWQFIEIKHRAWHAGPSRYFAEGKMWSDFNKFSIGIELEGDGNERKFTKEQYKALAALCHNLMGRFNIPFNNILGHEQIAPDRKVNPGQYFDWKLLRVLVDGMAIDVVVEHEVKDEPQTRPPLLDGKHETALDFIMRFLVLIKNLFRGKK